MADPIVPIILDDVDLVTGPEPIQAFGYTSTFTEITKAESQNIERIQILEFTLVDYVSGLPVIGENCNSNGDGTGDCTDRPDTGMLYPRG